MEHVTEQTSNPFGLRPPFEKQPSGTRPAVFGYGDVNADFHVIGDHPGVHGGAESGVPFTGTATGEAVWTFLADLGFATVGSGRPTVSNCFCSYRHLCRLPTERSPTAEEYATLEPSFDAELRAINAHVLCPVGDRATDHVLRAYTTQRRHFEGDSTPSSGARRHSNSSLADRLHAREIRGRGFMVVPLADPGTWAPADRARALHTLEAVIESDYRQTKGVATTVG